MAPPPPPAAAPSSAPVIRSEVDPNAAAAAATATMNDRIHFDYNMSDINSADQSRLDLKAGLMKQFPALRILITGNCDERGSDEYNIALGMRRATAAKDYLIRVGIDASRIDVSSLGRQSPIDPGQTDAAYAANRRDEFKIVAGSQSLRGR
jgi:peptidoglycan-associated lipoprotein